MQLDLQIGLIDSEEQLDDMLSAPTQALCDTLGRLDGDIMVLGVGGKMGPTLAKLARRAIDLCGSNKQVIGVSRFTSDGLYRDLNESGIHTIHCDLLDEAGRGGPARRPQRDLPGRPQVRHDEDAAFTWAMNTYVPALVAPAFPRLPHRRPVDRQRVSLEPGASPGPNESDPVGPVGRVCAVLPGARADLRVLLQPIPHADGDGPAELRGGTALRRAAGHRPQGPLRPADRPGHRATSTSSGSATPTRRSSAAWRSARARRRS